jgi:hypothetical protein
MKTCGSLKRRTDAKRHSKLGDGPSKHKNLIYLQQEVHPNIPLF